MSKRSAKIILFSIMLIIPVFILITMWIAGSQKSRQLVCFSITDSQRTLDSLFRKVSCKGIITEIKRETYADHDNYTYLYINPLPKTSYIGLRQSSRKLNFSEQSVNGSLFQKARLGLKGNVADFIHVGDTFVKQLGEHLFEVFTTHGDTLMSEPGFNAPCDGRRCVYERNGERLCYH